MSVSLQQPLRDSSIALDDLPEGKIAVITEHLSPSYVGDVIQRWGNHLIVVGADSRHSWLNWYGPSAVRDATNYRCRVLEPGTAIVVNVD